MSDFPVVPSPERFHVRLDERQTRIFQRLQLIGPGPAAFFRDACYLLQSPTPLSSTSHLAGHLLREIESAIRAVIKNTVVTSEPNRATDTNHRQQILQILSSLEIGEGDPIAEVWLRLGESTNAFALHRIAHRDSLAAPKPADTEFRSFWDEAQTLFDIILDRFESRYLAIMPTLDRLIASKNPTPADAVFLKNNVPNNLATLRYFFDRLETPAWLEPLQQEGFFARPPEAIVNEEGHAVSFPYWPVLRYLLRMVSHGPELVALIASAIPLTDNTSVHFELLEIAIALPAELAAGLVSQLKHGVECRYLDLSFTHKLGKLLLHLSIAPRNCDSVLELARTAFELIQKDDEPDGKRSGSPRFLKTRTRMNLHDFERIVHETAKPLARHCGRPALEMFCDLLEQAVSAHRKDSVDGEDWSYIWCPDVEHCPGARDLRCVLVEAVRDAAKCLIEGGGVTVRDTVISLEARSWKVFERIVLHVLRLFPTDSLVAECLLDSDAFDDATLRREYDALMAGSFGSLDSKGQETILEWIEEGPELRADCDGAEQFAGNRPTEQEANLFAETWRLRHLHPIRDSLSPAWRARYDHLIEQFGAPQVTPPFSTYSRARQSPLDTNQLRSMDNSAIVDFLEDWTPAADDHFGQSQEDLAHALQRVVADEPRRFVEAAELFVELHAVYVAALLKGLRDAIRQAWPTDLWPCTLRFCSFVLAQSIDYVEDDVGSVHPLRWCRELVVEFLSAGLDRHATQLPFNLRREVWEILRLLTDDRDPTPEDEGLEARGHIDPFSRSLASVRGEALHAVFKYAIWVWCALRPEESVAPPRGLDDLPEVREVLDRHLDVEIDPSPAIRSVYGQWFQWLVTIDERWACAHVAAVFPDEPAQASLWEAAWLPYIVFCGYCNRTFELLHRQYLRAISEVHREASFKPAANADHRECLAKHLMIFYARGLIDVDVPGSLLDHFFRESPLELRRYALRCVVKDFRDADAQISQEIIVRFQRLWEWRTRALRETEDRASLSELEMFGWWFASAKFDQRWALEQLRESLEMCGWVEPDPYVVEQLAAIASEFPKEAIACLSILVDNNHRGWGISCWGEHLTAILETILNLGEEDARPSAIALVNRLCARGFHEFRDLIA